MLSSSCSSPTCGWQQSCLRCNHALRESSAGRQRRVTTFWADSPSERTSVAKPSELVAAAAAAGKYSFAGLSTGGQPPPSCSDSFAWSRTASIFGAVCRSLCPCVFRSAGSLRSLRLRGCLHHTRRGGHLGSVGQRLCKCPHFASHCRACCNWTCCRKRKAWTLVASWRSPQLAEITLAGEPALAQLSVTTSRLPLFLLPNKCQTAGEGRVSF